MKRTLIFGASLGGLNFISNSTEKREYLAFIDNDQEKYNSVLQNLKIISPSSIANYDYDEIVIASYWATSIKKQLITELHINEKHIYVPPKEMLMDISQPFEDEKSIIFAKEVIALFSKEAIVQNIPLFINNGTLLGIIRDNDILAWDTDLDFAILEHHAFNFNLEYFIIQILSKINNLQFKLTKIIDSSNRILSYKVDFIKDNIVSFPISIEIMGIKDDFAIELVSLGQFKVPKNHLLTLDKRTFYNTQIYIPTEVEQYLKYIYGDWKTPKKNINFTDYSNYNLISQEVFTNADIQQVIVHNTISGT